jgi:uncharacterized Zn finger protein (UPF0148 family)
MSEPIIARHCPSCGASIRDLAFFCPQCGRELSQPGVKHPQNPVHQGPTEPLQQNTAPLSETLAEPRRDQQLDPSNVRPTASRAVGAKLQRAGTLARNVEGDMVQRVKNVRKMSTVVLDEAAYDPSLRFVLVAAVLFILFLVIVLLNRFIS